MKKEEIEKLAEKDLHPQLIDQLVYWQDRATNTDIFIRLEDLWAIQYRWKYQALRRVGFGKLTALIMTIKVMK